MANRSSDVTVSIREVDEAIDQLLERIATEPDYLPHHQAIFELARRRKVAGGKRVSSAVWPRRHKTAVERMVAMERAWVCDLLDVSALVKLIKAAERVAKDDATRGMPRIVEWLRSTAEAFVSGAARDD